MKDKAIICCALSGVAANREQCPAIPYTPEEYAEESRRAYEAGASVVHIHARTPDGAPSFEVADYRSIRDAIVEAVPDIIINFSTGAVGIDRERRIHQVRELSPEIAALNMGSMNYAILSRSAGKFVFDAVFPNSFSDIAFFLDVMQEAGSKPELECFDAGHINNALLMRDVGYPLPRPHFSLIMGVHGGIRATPQNLLNQVALLPPDAHWQVIGVRNPLQWEMLSVALGAGGGVRVGLEDNFYLPNGDMAGSNGDLVAHAARMVRSVGRDPATPAEARQILELKVSA